MEDHTKHSDRMESSRAALPALARLDDLHDYEVADGQPDIRGWEVKTPDGSVVGKVDDLIADTRAMKIRYIEMKSGRDVLGTDRDEHVLVPIEAARLDDDHDTVLVDRLPAGGLRGIPRFGKEPMTVERERTLHMSYFGAAPLGEHHDSSRFFGSRRTTPADAPYLRQSPPSR